MLILAVVVIDIALLVAAGVYLAYQNHQKQSVLWALRYNKKFLTIDEIAMVLEYLEKRPKGSVNQHYLYQRLRVLVKEGKVAQLSDDKKPPYNIVFGYVSAL